MTETTQQTVSATTPNSQTAGTPAQQSAGGSVSVFSADPALRGQPKIQVQKHPAFLGNFAACGFKANLEFQGKKPLQFQPVAKPLLGQFGIGQPAVLAPVNPRTVHVAPLQPISYMPQKMVLPQLRTQVPKGQVLQNTPTGVYYPEPIEQVEPDQLEHDMTNGDIVGDYPENFSAEQEGEEEQILEAEKQMEEAVQQEQREEEQREEEQREEERREVEQREEEQREEEQREVEQREGEHETVEAEEVAPVEEEEAGSFLNWKQQVEEQAAEKEEVAEEVVEEAA